MRSTLALAFTLSLVSAPTVSLPARPAASSQLTATDRAEIDALLRRWEKAWEDGDAVAWANLFHEDGTWILYTGGEWRGRAEIAAKFEEPFRTFYKDSIQLSKPFEMRMIAPDVAVVRTMTTLTGDTRQPGVAIHAKKILVLTKRGGRWGILYGQNTRLNDAEAAKVK